MRFGDRNCTIIGVMPPGFDLPFAAEVWLPLQLSLQSLPPDQMAARNYDLVARLKPGVSVAQADAESKSIARQLEQEHPQINRGWGFTFISMRRHLLGDLDGRIHQAIYALLAAVGFLLLICCVNVASLLLAQGAVRERELALAVTLLTSGGLLVQSFQRLQRIDLGFRPDHLLTLQTALSATKYPDARQRVRLADQIIEQVRALPGVVAVGTTTNLPLNIGSWDSGFAVEGRPPANPGEAPITAHRLVAGEYLEALGVTLMSGRLLTAADGVGCARA